MKEHFWLGMAVIAASGAFNGSFAAPMKASRRWKWENTWLVFALVALLILPGCLAAGWVPHLADVYRGAPGRALFLPAAFGFLWGIAQVTFGLGIEAVGMALAFTVVSGLGCLFGSLIPLLVLHPGDLSQPKGIMLLVSMPILFGGLILYAKAGRRREREQASSDTPKSRLNYSFAAGVGICIFTGVVGSAWNLGFAFSGSLLERSREMGAGALASPYAVWVVILGAGLIPNLVYCVWLLSRNGSWAMFTAAGSLRESLLGGAMGLLWLSGIVGYGIGATLVGSYGTSVGFALFIAAQIFWSNALGVLTGEWKATSGRTRQVLLAAVLVTLISVVVLNLGGLF
jgi:L-rhamnose-H+ transport protein